MAYRYADVVEDLDHSKFWERFVSERVASAGQSRGDNPFAGPDECVQEDPIRLERHLLKQLKARKPKVARTAKLLAEHPYGFPRGRIALVDEAYRVYHGSDIPKASEIDRSFIEVIFGIKGKAKWVADDHEHCLLADKEAIRSILNIEQDWNAV